MMLVIHLRAPKIYDRRNLINEQAVADWTVEWRFTAYKGFEFLI